MTTRAAIPPAAPPTTNELLETPLDGGDGSAEDGPE